MRLFRFVADRIGFMVEYLPCRRAGDSGPDRRSGEICFQYADYDSGSSFCVDHPVYRPV